MMIFGRELRLPMDLYIGEIPSEPSPSNEYVASLTSRLRKVHKLVRENIRSSSRRMKTRYNLSAKANPFKEGDLVWLYYPKRRKGRCPKLQRNWEGPYTIVGLIGDVNYRIRKGNSTKVHIIHRNRLAPYFPPADS